MLAAHSNAAVATVFSGVPADLSLTHWDGICGFKNSRDAHNARVAEDDAALAAVGATPIRLPFLDCQYGDSSSISEISDVLQDTIMACGAKVIAIPLGLCHFDHGVVGNAGCIVMGRMPELAWFAYEDAVYRQMNKATEERIAYLESFRINVQRAEILMQSDMESIQSDRLKLVAVHHYGSQLRALESTAISYQDVFERERYWRLHMK